MPNMQDEHWHPGSGKHAYVLPVAHAGQCHRHKTERRVYTGCSEPGERACVLPVGATDAK